VLKQYSTHGYIRRCDTVIVVVVVVVTIVDNIDPV
jgi:hypothetical protein